MSARKQPHDRIDRSSPTPLYHQLEQILRAEIDRGIYRPGDPLPSESEVCERYDVSRSVVRQTLQNLAHAGLVRTQRGRGSFVAEKKLSERFVQRATGFYDDLTRMGLEIQTKVLRQEITTVPLEVRDFLGVSEAIRIDRVRSVAGRVLAYVITYLPSARCPGLETHDLNDCSLYAHLAHEYGLKVHSGRRTVEAVSADADVAPYLEIEEGTPVLLLRSGSRTEDSEPLEWFEAWHRADRTRFEVEIVPGDHFRPFQQTVISGTEDGRLHGTARPVPEGFWSTALGTRLRRERAVAVVRAPHYAHGALIAAALARSGVSIVEFTLTGDNALDAITQARGETDAIVGAGSVVDSASARRAVDAGAQFVVCPAGVRGVVGTEVSVPVLLAGFTSTEVLAAHELTGAPVKVFPASVGGPSYLRALSAPLPQVDLMPSGGVDVSNAADYLRAGAVAVNIGGSLCPVEAVTSGDADTLTRRAKDLRAAIDEVER